MSTESSDYHCYGTPLHDEADTAASWKKTIKDPTLLRSLPIYKQKAVDEKGRARFHGAFTGGYSAGYNNSVGSADGFTPAEFSSSRSNRASGKPQSVLDFMDEDELAEHNKAAVQTKELYDTYGERPREAAAGAAEAELAKRPGLEVGLGLLDVLMPVADSAGMRLLRKMGWRPGRGVGLKASSQGTGSKWGSVSGVSMDNTPLYVLEPKLDVHGLGFDPFVGAEEFREARERKRQRLDGPGGRAGPGRGAGGRGGASGAGVNAEKRSRGIAFGSGMQDEDDAGVLEDYVEQGGGRLGYSFELMSESDDEDRFDPNRKKTGPLRLEQGSPRQMLQYRTPLSSSGPASFISGFLVDKGMLETLMPEPPAPPADFNGLHTFPPAPASQPEASALPPPPEVPPPADPALRKEIDSLAAQVARSGLVLEKVARNMASKGTGFLFLQGGEGSNYYKWRLHKIKAAFAAVQGGASQPPAPGPPSHQPEQKAPLTVQQRMELLGEQPLPSSIPTPPAAPDERQPVGHKSPAGLDGNRPASGIVDSDRQRLQAALSSNFVKGETQEQAGAQGGLRGGELLPAAAAALAASFGSRFTSSTLAPAGAVIEASASSFVQRHGADQAGAAAAPAAAEPRRTIFDWRPEPLLCKRFNVPDPYKGRPPPPPIFQQLTSLSRADMLALPDTAAKIAAERAVAAAAGQALAERAVAAAQAVAEQAVQGGQEGGGVAAGGSKDEGAGVTEGVGRVSGAGGVASGVDAKTYASQFLSSLEHMLLAPEDDAALPLAPQPLPAAGTDTARNGDMGSKAKEATAQEPEEVAEPQLSKPLDLFKAIFEADDEEEEEEEEEETPLPQPHAEPPAPEHLPAAAPVPGAQELGAATVPAEHAAGTAHELRPAETGKPPTTASELGAALMRAQEIAAQRLQERREQGAARGVSVAPPLANALPPALHSGAPPAVRKQEDIIREALRELKKSKHKKKEHKKSGKKKSAKDERKHKKNSKSKLEKKKHKKSRSSKRRRGSDDSGTDTESSSD